MHPIYLFAIFAALPFAGQSGAESADSQPSERFSIGLIADCQYAEAPAEKNRFYPLSVGKLEEAVKTFNTRDLAFIMQLGDLIDRDEQSYKTILPVLNLLKAPVHNVLGNHDFSIEDSQRPSLNELLNMPARYYSFTHGNWRFIVLDGNDVSLYAYPAGSKEADNSRKWHEAHAAEKPEYNGALGEEQLSWLKRALDDARAANEEVIIFCHFPVWPESDLTLWNSTEVLALVDNYTNVRAWIAGHHHPGNYATRNGIHHLTLKGMVDTEENAYSILKVHAERLELIGFGREPSREMPRSGATVAVEK